MAIRAVWRPPWYAWTLAGLAGIALIYKAAPDRLQGRGALLTPVVVLVGVLVVRKLWELPPAATMCAAIVLTIFSGAWRLMGLGGLPLDRLLALIVVLQFLLRAPGVAHSPLLQLRNVHLLLGLTILYVVASALVAGTLTNEAGFLGLIDETGVMPYVLFLVAPAVFATRRERDLLLVTLVCLGAYLGVTAIFETLGPHGLVFPSYIAHIDTALAESRADGPFQSSVAEGFANFACAVAAVMALSKWQDRRKRYCACFVIAVCMLGCFLTLERGVWIAAAAATVVTALASRTGRRWLAPGTLTCAAVIGGILLISPAVASKASTRVSDQLSVWDRQNQTSAAIRMLTAKPLLGFGWDSYTSDSLEYFRQSPEYPLTGTPTMTASVAVGKLLPLHNTYLAYAVELGLLGGLLWLASLVWGIGGAVLERGSPDLNRWKLGLLAIAVFYAVVAGFNPYQQAFPALLLWTWAGIAVGSAPLSVQARRVKAASQTDGSGRLLPLLGQG